MLPQFWPAGGPKMIENDVFLSVGKTNYSIHFSLGVYTCWVSVQNSFIFWAMDQFRPTSGQEITENGGFRPLSEKLFTQSS